MSVNIFEPVEVFESEWNDSDKVGNKEKAERNRTTYNV